MKIITDPGSCHMGEIGKAKDLVSISADCGASACKFQLFRDKPPNIPIPYKWLNELIEYGNRQNIEVFASPFDEVAYKVVKEHCRSLKIAYSMRNDSWLLESFPRFQWDNVYISQHPLDRRIVGTTRLYVHTSNGVPEYPVTSHINMSELFVDNRFDGYSAHCFGLSQKLNAKRSGANVIEVHIRGNWDCDCPDGVFALRPKELADLCEQTKGKPCI